MKKNPTILLAALTLTAILLGVILLTLPARPAVASMINTQPGVTMLTAGREDGSMQYIVVIDKSSDKLIVYSMSPANDLEVAAIMDYNRVFAAPAGPPTRTGY